MILQMLFIVSYALFGAAYATEPVVLGKALCESVFSDNHRTLNRDIFTHLLESDRESKGIPETGKFLTIDANRRLRFYSKNEERILREESLKTIGESFTAAEVSVLEGIFSSYSIYVAPSGNGTYAVSRWVPGEQIKLDVHTNYIRADDLVVKEMLDILIKSRAPGTSAMLFLDLDNLNLVNYLPGGHALGDRYIRESLRVIASSLRLSSADAARSQTDSRDIGFRLQNGDEYFFLLQNVTPQSIVLIQSRIDRAMRADAEIQKITRSSVEAYGKFLENLTKLESFQDLQKYSDPLNNVYEFIMQSKLWAETSATQQYRISRYPVDFKEFMRAYVASPEVKLRGDRIAHVRIGASTSAVMIRPAHTYENLKNEADQVMQEVKISRKYDALESTQTELIVTSKSDIKFPEFEILP